AVRGLCPARPILRMWMARREIVAQEDAGVWCKPASVLHAPDGERMDLEGKTALVIGANRGIGRAIALRFAAERARVIVHYGHDQRGAEEVGRQMREFGREPLLAGADLSSIAGVDTLFEILDRDTHTQLDIVVNNTGIWFRAEIAQTTEEMFD